ncbi:hypothetical protein [Desulforhabdus amnigena]|jgi:hypothetical protein|uniref:Uncharacterized protein n=1 Tax=Desulforhabdus amnigena TaxID=40218 RepID=A0A9W6LAI6_9BACT|nr:hypothetical protein [Desulforhabdus amnigena]NLJ26413.1 hypothetical protein [Deltaproteobacteria bacterium]GLI36105.1 hypothetical protein DAMNIGENAA_35380 [Desulforhabdus amnigena]
MKMNMKTTLTVVGVAGVLLLLQTPPSYGKQIIECRDAKGFKTGSATVEDDGSVIYRDEKGFKKGATRIRNGKTIFYDKNGRKTGECDGYLPLLPGCKHK